MRLEPTPSKGFLENGALNRSVLRNRKNLKRFEAYGTAQGTGSDHDREITMDGVGVRRQP